MVLGNGAFGKRLGHEDRALKHGINNSYKTKTHNDLWPITTGQDTGISYEPERGPSLDHNGTSSLQNYEK